jgi:hypothetical protein
VGIAEIKKSNEDKKSEMRDIRGIGTGRGGFKR